MAIAQASQPDELFGVTQPRISPPAPLSSRLAEWKAEAAGMGITPLDWQSIAASYVMATCPTGWLYPEVAVAVSRQNGKTEILAPRIRDDLKRGRRVIHTAQNRTLPRQVFLRVARSVDPSDIFAIRYANGQEKIEMANGGSYQIIAPQRGARGLSGDTLLIDELREFEGWDIIDAASPTLTASLDPQTIFLSNAGSDVSVILNDLKRRGLEGAEDLAYLEWSAAPERDIGDREGWAEGNPSLGHFPAMRKFLEKQFVSVPPATFETEHLCRWVNSMQPRLVSSAAWDLCRGTVEEPSNPHLGINMDPSGTRASAVMAWQQSNGRIACVELKEAIGDPIDVEALGKDLRDLVALHKIRSTGFASWTDADLARSLLNAKPLDAKEFANASENFVRVIQSGRLIWDSADHITSDLGWTARKPHESGAWVAVKAGDRPITASLAAIRAVWLASAPKQSAPQVF